MSQYSALYSIVFMICFVLLFDRRHRHHRLQRVFASVALMTTDELGWIRKIQSACEEEA